MPDTTTAAMETEVPDAAANTYFTPLKTMDFFARTFHLLARKPATFLVISFLFVGLHAGFQWLTDYLVPSANISDDSNAATDAYDDVFTFDSFANLFVEMANWIIFYVAVCLADGATVRAVADLYVGEDRNVTAALAIGTAAQHLVQLVGACLVVTAALAVPLFVLLLIYAGILMNGGGQQFFVVVVLCTLALALVVAVLTYHMYPVVIVEKAGIIESVQRSIRLTEGHRGEIFSILLLLNVFKFVLVMLFTLMALAIDTTADRYIVGVVDFLMLVFTSSFGSM